MSRPALDPELTAVLEVLEHELGPLQVLYVRPTQPRRSAIPPAPGAAGPDQPSLFDPPPDPALARDRAPRPVPVPTSSRPGGTADELV